MKTKGVKRARLSIRQSGILYLLISIALGLGVFFLQDSVKHEMTASISLMKMNRLSNDLVNTAYYLSQEARTYVNDLDENHLLNYWNIVDVDKTREKIIYELKKYYLPQNEFSLIEEFKKSSDTLIRTETRAMRLVFDSTGSPHGITYPNLFNFNLDPADRLIPTEQKFEMGKRILYGSWYENEIERIKDPIDLFRQMIRNRLGNDIQKAKRQSNWFIFVLIVLSIFIPILLMIDIARRRKIEEALRNTEEQSRLIIETANDAFIGMDMHGKIIYWNRQAELTFGWTREEIIGRLLSETIIPQKFRKAHTDGLRHFFETGEGPVLNRRIEMEALHQDGHEFPVELTVWAIRIGQAYQFNAFVHDITERRLAEERLKKANEELTHNQTRLLDMIERLRKAHLDLKSTQAQLVQSEKFATIGRLAGMISHEFRNELGVMRNAAYFLKMKWHNGDEKIRKHLEILEERISETDRIIENIMTFAKTQQPELKETDLGNLLRSGLDLLKIPPQIKILVDIPPDLPKVQADEIQLKRVFMNIILNAVQAIEGHGGKIRIRATCEKDHVLIYIEDSGPGIKKEDQAHLFEPLFTTKARGAGLGLATAQLLIEAHGGTINIESEWGKGTCVAMRLPVS